MTRVGKLGWEISWGNSAVIIHRKKYTYSLFQLPVWAEKVIQKVGLLNVIAEVGDIDWKEEIRNEEKMRLEKRREVECWRWFVWNENEANLIVFLRRRTRKKGRGGGMRASRGKRISHSGEGGLDRGWKNNIARLRRILYCVDSEGFPDEVEERLWEVLLSLVGWWNDKWRLSLFHTLESEEETRRFRVKGEKKTFRWWR